MKNNTILINIIVGLVIGALAFYGGIQYQKQQRPNFANGQFRQFGGGQLNKEGDRTLGPAMRGVIGEIISKDATSITIKSQDGSSKIVFLSDKLAITKEENGSLTDLKTGEQVAAFGKQNADGSVSADIIRLNPQMRMFSRPTGTQSK